MQHLRLVNSCARIDELGAQVGAHPTFIHGVEERGSGDDKAWRYGESRSGQHAEVRSLAARRGDVIAAELVEPANHSSHHEPASARSAGRPASSAPVNSMNASHARGANTDAVPPSRSSATPSISATSSALAPARAAALA